MTANLRSLGNSEFAIPGYNYVINFHARELVMRCVYYCPLFEGFNLPWKSSHYAYAVTRGVKRFQVARAESMTLKKTKETL